MVHYDVRVEWIRDRVFSYFQLPSPDCFEDLLSRGDGEDEQRIIAFLNSVTEEETASALLFVRGVREEEVHVEVPVPAGRWQSCRGTMTVHCTPLTFTPLLDSLFIY